MWDGANIRGASAKRACRPGSEGECDNRLSEHTASGQNLVNRKVRSRAARNRIVV